MSELQKLPVDPKKTETITILKAENKASKALAELKGIANWSSRLPTAHKRHFAESHFWVRNKKRQSHGGQSLQIYNRLHKRCYAAQNAAKKSLSVFTDYLLRGKGLICTIFDVFGTYLDHMSQKRL